MSERSEFAGARREPTGSSQPAQADLPRSWERPNDPVPQGDVGGEVWQRIGRAVVWPRSTSETGIRPTAWISGTKPLALAGGSLLSIPKIGWYPSQVKETTDEPLFSTLSIRRYILSSRYGLLTVLLIGAASLSAAENDTATDPVDRAVHDQREAAFQFARAKLLAEEGAFGRALKSYERALELDGSDPYSRIEVARLHSYLAQISRSAEKQVEYLAAAAGYAAEARQIEPENLEILRSYAQIHLRLGEHQLAALNQAQEAYEELRENTVGDLQVLTSLGQIYLLKQQAEEAAEVLEEAASYRPNHRMIQTMLLEALLTAERYSDAEKALGQLIELEPTSLEYRMRLAELESRRGDHRAAARTLSEAPGEMADNERLQQFLAQELHLSGANEEALALVDSLRTEMPYSPGARRLKVAILSALTRYGEAIEELEPLLASGTGDDRWVQDTLLLSRLLERVGRFEDAGGVLRQKIEAGDAEDQLQLKLALTVVLERQGLMQEAVDLLKEETAAADEHLPMLSRGLGELLGRLDRTGEGLAALDSAILRLRASDRSEAAESLALRRLTLLASAEDWPALEEQAPKLFDVSSREVRAAAEVLYAEALANQDRVDDALEVLSSEESAINEQRRLARQAELLHRHGRVDEANERLVGMRENGDRDDLFFVAQVYQRLELYAESVPLLERLLEGEPDSQQTLFLLGAANERSGERARAVDAFKRLLELAPDHAPTLNYLGYMWAEAGENLAEALLLILRAVAQDPDNGAYVDSLGWAYFQLGRYEEAREHLEWAARLVPDDATILEHLGDLYVALEDIERAKASYQQALDLGGGGEETDDLRRKLKTLEEKDL